MAVKVDSAPTNALSLADLPQKAAKIVKVYKKKPATIVVSVTREPAAEHVVKPVETATP